MKSIIEEASSILKAIDKGWARAGKPQEFLVKVLEEPQKNFFGFTKKSAKVSLFFQDRPQQPERGKRPQQAAQTRSKVAPVTNKPAPYTKEKAAAPQQPQRNNQSQQQQPKPQQQAQPQQPKQDPWTPSMVQASKDWMNTSLQIMGKANIPFTVDVKNYYLTIAFESPLLDNPEKTKTIFRSFSYLLMQSLRNQFKKSFKGHKIIIRGIGTDEDVRRS